MAAFGAMAVLTAVAPAVASAAPSATVGKLIMSPVPIAAAGSLKAKGAVAVTVTAETVRGIPLGGATVYLSFTPTTGGGSATTHKLALTGTPVAIKTDKAGTIKVTYHAPANPQPTSGTDTLTAANAPTAATITTNDTYTFAAVTTGISSFAASPGPIAATHTLAAKGTVTVTVTAKDSVVAGIPHADVYLSFVQAAGGGTAAAHGHLLSSTPQLFKTDATGAIKVVYRTGATLPATGTDAIKFANAATGATVTSSDTYSF